MLDVTSEKRGGNWQDFETHSNRMRKKQARWKKSRKSVRESE